MARTRAESVLQELDQWRVLLQKLGVVEVDMTVRSPLVLDQVGPADEPGRHATEDRLVPVGPGVFEGQPVYRHQNVDANRREADLVEETRSEEHTSELQSPMYL